MSKKKKFDWYWGASLILCFGIAMLGSMAMGQSLSAWYLGLAKPPFNPPSWLFGPAWTILFFLMSWSFVLVMRKQYDKKALPAVVAFLVQLAFNGLWSWLFFYYHQLSFSFYEIIFLWFLILATIILSWRVDKKAGWLLIPYIAWVSYASLLTGSI